MNEPLPSNPELELDISRQWEKKEVWQVYSDWLQSQGHPMGEIVALELACLNEDKRDEMETKLRARIQDISPDRGQGMYYESDHLGRLNKIRSSEANDSELSMNWENGFVYMIILNLNVHENHEQLLKELEILLTSSYTHLLHDLWFRVSLKEPENKGHEAPGPSLKTPEVIYAELLKILTKTRAGKNLQRLDLMANENTAQINELDIAPLVSYFPNLRRLNVQGEFGISKLKNQSLKELALFTEDISPVWHGILSAPRMQKLKSFGCIIANQERPLKGNLSFLLENEALQHLNQLYMSFDTANQDCRQVFTKLSLPKLKSLYISLDRNKTELSDWRIFQPFFQKALLPSLTELEISIKGHESELLLELANSPLLPGLKGLKMFGNFKGDDVFQVLREHAKSFQHLKLLRVSRVRLSPEKKEKLYSLFGKKVLKMLP